MTIRSLTGVAFGLRLTLAQFRKPELMVFVPALTQPLSGLAASAF